MLQPINQSGFGGDYNYNQPVTVQTSVNLCNPETTLWMGDLKPDWDADFIKKAFQKLSHLPCNIKMVTDRFGSKSSYCFVEFSNPELARNAMLELCGRSIPNDLDRQKFNLSFANSPDQCPEFNLFVSNLSSSVDDVALFRVFGEQYTSCRGAKVYRNSDGSSREFGFVRFTNETDQQRALVEMNKHRLKNKEMILKLAQPKERRNRTYPLKSFSDRLGSNRNTGGSRYGNGNFSYNNQTGPTSVVPMTGIIGCGLSMNSLSYQQQSHHMSSYLNANHNVSRFSQSGISTQIPYNGQMSNLQTGSQFIMNSSLQYPGLVLPNSNVQFQNGGSMIPINDLRNLHPNSYSSVTSFSTNRVVPAPIYFEGEEPLSAEEHNNLVMRLSGDFLTTLESSRWNRIAVPMAVRPKEMTSMLYNI